MAIKTGDFSITFYDEKNARVTNIKEKAISLTQAQDKGNKCIREYEHIKSFTVDRRTFNSIDNGQW